MLVALTGILPIYFHLSFPLSLSPASPSLSSLLCMPFFPFSLSHNHNVPFTTTIWSLALASYVVPSEKLQTSRMDQNSVLVCFLMHERVLDLLMVILCMYPWQFISWYIHCLCKTAHLYCRHGDPKCNRWFIPGSHLGVYSQWRRSGMVGWIRSAMDWKCAWRLMRNVWCVGISFMLYILSMNDCLCGILLGTYNCMCLDLKGGGDQWRIWTCAWWYRGRTVLSIYQ